MPTTKGYTLIEMIMVLIVVGIMAAALAPLALSSLRAYEETLADVVVLDKLRYATERLAREIREVKRASSSTIPATTCPSLPTPGATDQYCLGTLVQNGNSLSFDRTFYEFSGTPDATVTVGTTTTVSASCVIGRAPCVTLTYSSGGDAQVLTDELGNTGNLVFTYLDASGVALTSTPTATTVSAVQIKLTLRHNNQDYTQKTVVHLKNL